MRKILLLCVTALFCLALAATAMANPFNDRFRAQANQERQAGLVKYVFVLFDENNSMLNQKFSVFYNDNDNVTKEQESDATGKVTIVFEDPNTVRFLKVRINFEDYGLVGDTYENHDSSDVREGDVNYYALQLNRAERLIYIYDAD